MHCMLCVLCYLVLELDVLPPSPLRGPFSAGSGTTIKPYLGIPFAIECAFRINWRVSFRLADVPLIPSSKFSGFFEQNGDLRGCVRINPSARGEVAV